MLWVEQRVIVVLDGWDTNRTWRQLANEPEVLLAAVEKLLAARPAVVL